MNKIYFFSLFMTFFLATAQNTVLEADINVGDGNSTPTQLTEYDGELIFRASNGTSSSGGSGNELFKFTIDDGAELVVDLRPGSNSTPNNLTLFDGKLFFTAFDVNVGGVDLFSYDGVEVSSESLYGNQFSGLFNPVVHNCKIYFTGFDSNFTFNRLIEFDGTTGGEVPGSGDEVVLGGQFIGLGDHLLVYMNLATEPTDVGRELYKYSIPDETFELVKDINPGDENSNLSNFAKLDNEVYFEALNELWKTDGTEAGTLKITATENENLEVDDLFVWEGDLYFEGNNDDGRELWKYNPVADEATQLSSISGGNDDHRPSNFVIHNGFMYYAARDGQDTEDHLWRTDGITVEQLDDFIISVSELAVFDNRIFFRGEEENVTGNELYSFDPESLSVVQINPLNKLVVYPNPLQNTISFNQDLPDANYQLFNLQGKLIQQGEINNQSIQTNLQQGMYLLKVVDQDNFNKTFKLTVK